MEDILERYKQTQEFLDGAYETVVDKLVESWDFSKAEAQLEELVQAGYTRRSPPLSEEDEKEINKFCLHEVAVGYVVGMLHGIIDNGSGAYDFSAEELNRLWGNTCGTEEFAREQGLTREEGDLALKVTKEVFLEDLFAKPVTVFVDETEYTIGKANGSLYVRVQQ